MVTAPYVVETFVDMERVKAESQGGERDEIQLAKYSLRSLNTASARVVSKNNSTW